LVLPLDARVPPGRLPASAYTIYTFPDPDDSRLVVAETSNCLVHTTPDEVAGYERIHDRLRQAALPALESLSLLTDTADRLNEQAGPYPHLRRPPARGEQDRERASGAGRPQGRPGRDLPADD